MKNVIFTYGLPASGKTTIIESKYSNNSDIIDIDYYMKNNNTNIYKIIENEFKKCRKNNIVLDGLFTTNKSILDILNILPNDIKEITIIKFNEDRENCLKNDLLRNRSKNSQLSIKILPYEEIDEKLFINYNLIIKKEKVYIMKKYEEIALKYDVYLKESKYTSYEKDKKYIHSQSWSRGGVGRNCWGDRWDVKVENPVEFTELDTFLSKISPNISFLQYKRINNICIKEVEYDDSDYYSSTSSACYECDFEALIDYLEENNLLN